MKPRRTDRRGFFCVMANQTKAERQEKDTNAAFTVQLKNGRKLRVLPADEGVTTAPDNTETNQETAVPKQTAVDTETKDNGAIGGNQPDQPQAKMDVGYEMIGPVSFEEFEAIEDAAEKQSIMGSLVYKFREITNNIMRSLRLTPEEKVTAITDASGELRVRLGDAMMDGIVESKAENESGETAVTTYAKVSKTEGGTTYQASDYADVPDSSKPSTWKLRLAEGSSGNFTVAQVARAITAMQPSGFRGNRVELGQSRSAVVRKISGVIGRLDASDEQKSNLRKRLNAVKALRSGFKVIKSIDGRDRWLGWVTNNFLDRDGEILTEKSHQEYIEYLDANPSEAPELWTFHIKGTARKNKADFWGHVNGFVVMGGELTPQEAKSFNELGDTLDLAMSHGFFVYRKDGNEIGRYRTFEVSVLPRDEAANPWTDFTTVYEVNSMSKLTAKQRELAVQLHGEDFIQDLEESTKDRSELLKALGVQQKAKADEAEAEQAETTSETAVPDEQDDQQEDSGNDDTEKSVGTATLDEITKAVVKGLNLEGLAQAIKAQNDKVDEAIKAINGRLEALETDTDEKMEKMLTPRAAGFDWSSAFRPSTHEKNAIEKDKDGKPKEEIGSTPETEVTWVSETFGQVANGNGR